MIKMLRRSIFDGTGAYLTLVTCCKAANFDSLDFWQGLNGAGTMWHQFSSLSVMVLLSAVLFLEDNA